jgi:hypothetical protein
MAKLGTEGDFSLLILQQPLSVCEEEIKPENSVFLGAKLQVRVKKFSDFLRFSGLSFPSTGGEGLCEDCK